MLSNHAGDPGGGVTLCEAAASVEVRRSLDTLAGLSETNSHKKDKVAFDGCEYRLS